MAMVVVYGGGFQPFHAGHLSSYIAAKKAFPDADFYVAASADVKQRPIPYEVKKFLATQAGVKPEDFPDIVVTNPLNPKEILSKYDPDRDVYVLVRSERDPVPYVKKDGTPAYYQPFNKNAKLEPYSKHGYVFVTKKHDFELNGQKVYSGTQVRDMYKNADDQGRRQIVAQMYPKSKQQDKIKQFLDKYIGTEFVTPTKEKSTKAVNKLKNNPLKEEMLKFIQQARPLLEEADPEQQKKMFDLLKKSYNINPTIAETVIVKPDTDYLEEK